MKKEQVIVWLATPMAINGFPCSVLAADAIEADGNNVLLALAEGNLAVTAAHVYKPNNGNADDAIRVVNECGFLDVRVPA